MNADRLVAVLAITLLLVQSMASLITLFFQHLKALMSLCLRSHQGMFLNKSKKLGRVNNLSMDLNI